METKMIRASVEISIPHNLLEPLLDDETPTLAVRALLTGALADFNIRITRLVLSRKDLRRARSTSPGRKDA